MMHLDLVKADSGRMDSYHPFRETYKIFTIGKNCNSINYTAPKEKIRHNEKHLVHFESGAHPAMIHFLNQVHGEKIIPISSPEGSEQFAAGEGDAMISAAPGSCLVIRTADCIPIMMFDPAQKCIAAVHSGWRSTEMNITGKTIKLMCDNYNCTASNIYTIILPGIKADSYEVSADVAEKFPGHFTIKDGRYYLSLQSSIIQSIKEAGSTKGADFSHILRYVQ
jgi:YfiH family protein